MPDPASLPHQPAPQLVSITSTFFTNLLSRLGVRPPPTEGFDLITTVQPVSIVDQDVQLLVSQSSLLLDTPATAGEQTAPAALTILADTGPQPVGTYQLYVSAAAWDPAASNTIQLARRNAANNADIWLMNFPGQVGTATINVERTIRVQLQANERLVARNVGAGGAGSKYLVDVWLTAG